MWGKQSVVTPSTMDFWLWGAIALIAPTESAPVTGYIPEATTE